MTEVILAKLHAYRPHRCKKKLFTGIPPEFGVHLMSTYFEEQPWALSLVVSNLRLVGSLQ